MMQQVYCATLITVFVLRELTAQMQICTFTPRINGVYSNMTLNGVAEVNKEAVTGTQPNFAVNSNKISYMGMQVSKNGGLGPDIQMEFNVEVVNTVSSPDIFNISLILRNVDPTAISSATMEIRLGNYVQASWDVGIPAGSVKMGLSYVGYNSSSISSGSSVSIYFKAAPSGNGGVDLPEGNTELFASVYLTYQGTVYGAIILSICLKRVTVVHRNIVYQQGFTALTFFIMLIVGILLGLIGVRLFFQCQQGRTVFPYRLKPIKTLTTGKIFVNPPKSISSIACSDSILHILTLKDPLQIHREIDNLDIQSALNIDTDLEAEKIDAAVQASSLLVQGLRYNGDITKTIEDTANTNMQKRLKAVKAKMDADYSKQLKTLLTDIDAKNKGKYDDLLRKHEEEKRKKSEILKDLSASEKKQTLDTIDQQQQTEMNELKHKLTLEQNEGTETLRKEFADNKHVAVTEIQQQFIDDVIQMGNLNSEKAEWLIKEHKRQQEAIHLLYDEEISRQRMNLEDKVAKRKALALASERQADHHTESLNLMISLQPMLITNMRKQLQPEQVEEYLNQARKEIQAIKDQMDKERELKQNDLIKKHGQDKKKHLDEKINQQARELKTYSSHSIATQTEGPVDPVLYVDGLVKLKSQHRQELIEIENKIDEIQAKELEIVRNQVTENAKQKLMAIEKILVKNLMSQGMQRDVIDKLIQTHKKEVEKLISKQLTDKQQQELKLKNELARRRRELEDMRKREKNEQQEVREHETVLVKRLLSCQVAISDEQHHKILKEHEKHLVKLENSLTLNKLKQMRLLEEKIAQRKAQQLEELVQKQNAELAKMKKVAENNGEEDDEETHRKEIMMLKKHAEQQVALFQGLQLNNEQELKDIQIEMIKDRAITLKEQEERLSALIASLQMQKAKEITQVEEEQKAIIKLKIGMMDDLNDKGVLSTRAVEQILKDHEQEHDELNHKLEVEKKKKEEAFMVKYKQLLIQRQQSMIQKQKEEIDHFFNATANKASAKFKSALLKNKHVVEQEKFRNEMQREISQRREYFRRDFEIQKQKIIQAKEMQLLSGLVKIGKFGRNELTDVLHILFPGKTEEKVTELLNQIYQEDGKTKNQKEGDSSTMSTLVDKISEAQYTELSPMHRQRVPNRQVSTDSEMYLEETSQRKNTFNLHESIIPPVAQSSNSEYQNKNLFSAQNATQKYKAKQTNKQNLTNWKNNQKSERDNTPNTSEEDEYRHSKYHDKYHEEYEEVDYINKALSENDSQPSSSYPGRLPPLQNQGKRSSKKKKSFLKKLASESNAEN